MTKIRFGKMTRCSVYKRKDKTFMVDHIVQQLSQIHFSSVKNGTAEAKTPEITYNIYVIYIYVHFCTAAVLLYFNPFSFMHLFVLCTIRYLAERPRKVRGAYFQNTILYIRDTLSKTFTCFSQYRMIHP